MLWKAATGTEYAQQIVVVVPLLSILLLLLPPAISHPEPRQFAAGLAWAAGSRYPFHVVQNKKP